MNFSPIVISGQTTVFTKVGTRMIRNMARVNLPMKMESGMKELGKMVR